MKYILTIFFIATFFCGHGQTKKDSIPKTKTDTIYMIEVTDTVIQDFVLYDGGANTVKFSRPGYVLYKGFKQGKNGQLVWAQEPRFVGVLDDKKKPLKPLPKID